MAREAALMGVPSVSFFPNTRMLSVDQNLVDEGKMFHSFSPGEIVEYLIHSKGKDDPGQINSRSKIVKEMVMKELMNLLELS